MEELTSPIQSQFLWRRRPPREKQSNPSLQATARGGA
jgi:hypothetical protein